MITCRICWFLCSLLCNSLCSPTKHFLADWKYPCNKEWNLAWLASGKIWMSTKCNHKSQTATTLHRCSVEKNSYKPTQLRAVSPLRTGLHLCQNNQAMKNVAGTQNMVAKIASMMYNYCISFNNFFLPTS